MTDMRTKNRAARQAAAKFLGLENAKWPPRLTRLPKDQWPKRGPKESPIDIWRSNEFLVQSYAVPGHPDITRLSVNRTEIQMDGGWRQDISWEDLQRLKHEAGYGDRMAVEIFPKDDDVVNVANMRHIWVFLSGGLTFTWRKAK